MSFDDVFRVVNGHIDAEKKKKERLRNLDVLVLDNSLRESTVAQLRGHTLENKRKVYEEVKKCGFQYVIVGSFSHMTRMEDVFVKDLVARGEDMTDKFAFSEGFDKVIDGKPDLSKLPVGLRKCRDYGIPNVIFEIDLALQSIDWENKFTIHDMCKLMEERVKWCKENLSPNSKVLVNIRDLADTVVDHMEYMFILTKHLGSMDESVRPWGMVTEEGGKALPEEVGAWVKGIRMVMDSCNWPGQLLVHIHEKWGFCELTQLECMINGANGIWASVCQEGAAMGHACSAITLMNIVRLGNKKVRKRYNCQALRDAAINVTKITTGKPPHPKNPLYGERAFDIVFDFQFSARKARDGDDESFDLADFFKVDPPVRISELSSPAMIVTRLKNLFGEDSQFNEAMAIRMKETMLADLNAGRKEEYMSPAGVAVLFDRSGGKMTGKMADVIAEMKTKSATGQALIDEINAMWDEWDNTEEGDKKGDGMLNFRSFYSGFMANYFGCYTCADTQSCLRAIDMDKDDSVDWNEFLVYLKWAVRQYPNTTTAEELLEIAFTKGIMPAMRDVIVDKKQKK